MREINLSADELVKKLLSLPPELNLCLLDSCGVSYLDSHLLIAGISPLETLEISNSSAQKTLEILEKKTTVHNLTSFITISYDFGLKLNSIKTKFLPTDEPDIFLASFDVLIVYDYQTNQTFLSGNEQRFDEIEQLLLLKISENSPPCSKTSKVTSNFTKNEYLNGVELIQEFIRQGDTYQTNLTQQITAKLPDTLTPENIFLNLRKSHPSPFSSFIRRKNDVVISASPERFLRVKANKITTNPIKGTRPRGRNSAEDYRLKNELLASEKDRAENIMIVDLLRNDIGRICEFGSVRVEKLCELETHPTLFHLVSTVSGTLRPNTYFSDILRATFPCGSITGAPKIRTMQIIEEIETKPRQLSMGSIGIITQNIIDLSVAIRTMTVRDTQAIFNVGGGIVIDSDPHSEYEETLTKAKALLMAINGKLL